jgi:ketosteroid isomerase-like protein
VTGESIERLQQGLLAFVSSGETNTEFLSDDFELHQASSIIGTAGVFRGPGAMKQSLDELRESFDDLTFEPEEFLLAPGGEVVVLIHTRGRGRVSGTQVDNRIGWVWTFQGDKATRLVVYEEPDEALAAVGIER